MTIYDAKFYGVHYPKAKGDSKVLLSGSKEEVYEKAPEQFWFEVTLLKRYGSMKDVLRLQFVRGDVEYVTLYGPAMYLEDGEWKPTENMGVAKAFLKEYEKLENKLKEETISIFDITFFGALQDVGLFKPKAVVSISRENLEGNNSLSSDAIRFTARVLKKFRGKKYILELTSKDYVDYMPLFDNKLCYDSQINLWVPCNESPIPTKILKCYIKYLNE